MIVKKLMIGTLRESFVSNRTFFQPPDALSYLIP